jgi:hypothetical protein
MCPSSRDRDRLPGAAQVLRQIGMAGWQCPRRVLAVDAQLPSGVGFDRGEVMRHVIDQAQRRAGHAGEHAPGRLGQQLAVRPAVVRGGGHRAEVARPSGDPAGAQASCR